MAEPVRQGPDRKWEHLELWKSVQEALRALPGHFATKTNIEGMLATDIFTLNSALGAAIEEQVVTSLNAMRPLWDPDHEYTPYMFVRQPQTFPDVLFKKKTNDRDDILLGIELKGWYLLAKEGEPTFRFKVNKGSCTPADLIVVVPWTLSNVISGSPVVYSPYIEFASYAAEYRNYYWQTMRKTKDDTTIVPAKDMKPYPAKNDRIEDQAVRDGGGNFGRLSRSRLMDKFIADMMQTRLSGIEASEWLKFFRTFTEKYKKEKEDYMPEASGKDE